MHATSLCRSSLLSIAGAALLAPAAMAQTRAPAGLTVEDALPASTYAVARFGGLAACADAAEHMPLAQVVHDFLQKIPAEVREEHLEHGLEFAAEHVQQALQQVGISPADLRAIVGQPMALAIGRLTIEGMGPSLALVIEQGEHGEAVQRCFAALLQTAIRMHGNVGVESAAIDGCDVQLVTLPHAPPIFAGAVGGCFVITNSRGYLTEMASVAHGKAAGMRASSLANLRGSLATAPLASLFLNFAGINASIAPHLPYEAGQWSDALGLGALDSVYAATTAGDQGGTDLFSLNLGGSEKGLFKAISGAPVDLGFAAACSKNTVLFGAETFDLAGVIDAFHRVVALLPEAARSELMQNLGRELSRELRHAGTTPQAVGRLIHAFGSDVGFAIALEKGAVPKPEILLRIGVRDAGPVAALLQQLEAMTAGEGELEWKTRKVGEQEIRFCNVPLPDVNLQLSPCYLLQQDALWIASDTGALVRAMRQAESPAESLAAQPDFAQLTKASAGASSVLHVRWFRGVELGWRNVETLAYPLLDAHRDEVGFGSDALPDAETMAKALGCSSVIYRVGDDAVRCESRGPITLGSLLAAFGALADSVLNRASGEIR